MIAWGLALCFSFYGPDHIFNFFLQFLAWLVGPIAMTVITDYWFFPEHRKNYEAANGVPTMRINPAAYLAWIVGFLVGFYTQSFFISLINGMVVTAIVYYGWMRWALNHNTTPELQLKGWLGKKT